MKTLELKKKAKIVKPKKKNVNSNPKQKQGIIIKMENSTFRMKLNFNDISPP
jgi:hypothetical protein